MADTKSTDENSIRSPGVNRVLRGIAWVWAILAFGAYLPQFRDEAIAVLELLGLGGQ